MLEFSRPQLFVAESLIQEEIEPLWGPWIRHVDEVLADRELVQIAYAALAHVGREGYPWTTRNASRMMLRMLLLKYMRN